VGDSGLDDQKMFAQVGKLGQEFIFRVSLLERIVEVYNERLDGWETEKLQDLADSVPHQATFQVLFKQAGETRLNKVQFGWFKVRIPATQAPLWILVADDETLNRQRKIGYPYRPRLWVITREYSLDRAYQP
jgi:hypothetical protein